MFSTFRLNKSRARHGLLSAAVELLEGRRYFAVGVAAPVTYPTDSGPLAVTLADMNGDGKLDIITSNGVGSGNSGTVSVLLNNGNGTFAAEHDYPTLETSPRSIITGDFNKDGKTDVATCNANSTISVFLNTGGGVLATPSEYATNGSTQQMAVGDVNNDGSADIVSVSSGGALNVLLNNNNGSGTFQPTIYEPDGTNFSGLVLADFNGDGKLDIAATDFNASVIEVLLGNGSGHFAAFATTGAGAQPNDIEAADLNGDGKLDLITEAAGVSDSSISQLNIFPGVGDGNFTFLNSFTIDKSSSAVTVGDVDGNGKVEVISRGPDPTSGATRATIWQVASDGSLSLSTTIASPYVSNVAGSGPQAMAVGDLNGDGTADLVGIQQATGTANTVSVFLIGNGLGGGNTGTGSAITPKVSIVKPRSLLAGSKILPPLQVKIGLANTGATKSGAVKISLVASNDPTGVGGIAEKSTTFRGTILPHKSTTVSVALSSLPAGLTGSVYLVATITDSTGKTSIAASTALTVLPPTINFSAGAISAPTKAKSGAALTFSVGVTQIGNVAFGGQLGAELYLSSTPSLTNATDIGFATASIKLTPNKRGTLRLKKSLPAGTPGTFYLIARLDPGNAHNDVDLSNNVAISAKTIVIS